ncbi:hypothetical protein Pcinc_002756 [Petrolisthes cinctipes]|uniref:WW domain-containing oxidoreductase n=1 Tax=Petrolisthes cinctipes TaxID=88211 RepID=A0AAE1GPR4_PETCI|nr:hypothetical protein Pcinc_002756 [Petrolisthes cinctipes]
MDLPETDSEDEMAPGWEERCTADGFVFYAHHGTKTTQWQHPRTNKRKRVTGELPFGWERQITEDGKVFFVDHINHKTTYTDPRLAFAVEETHTLNDFRQRFDASSTGIQVLHGRDLSGKVAVVTGANCGVGYETVRSLAYHGCTVILACRDVRKGEAAVAQLQSQRPSASCHVMHLDLASLASVRTFAHTLTLRFRVCNILILNAGVLASQHSLTEDGYERTWQVNHLSQLYLALLLAPSLTTSARIIFVSCEAHRFAMLDTQTLTDEVLSPPHATSFTPIMAYCNTKLCNVLTALELQRRFGERGINCYAVHPGNALSSSLTRHWWGYRLLHSFVRPFTKSLQQACSSTVFCAASPDLAQYGGLYVNNCVPCRPAPAALDPVMANRLWVSSLAMIERILGRRAFNLQYLPGVEQKGQVKGDGSKQDDDTAEDWLSERFGKESPEYGTDYWAGHLHLTSQLPAPDNISGSVSSSCPHSTNKDGQ